MAKSWPSLLGGALLALGLVPVGHGAPDCPGSGFGGTGHAATPEPGTGFGGTGAQPCDGATALGVIGVITGFGSIFVGGQEVHYATDAAVQTPAGVRTPAALRLGQTVVVRAQVNGTRVEAEQITIAPVLVGPVQAVGDQALRALGQGVRLTSGTRLAGFGGTGPVPGQWVAVYGLRAGDGSIVATRVARREGAAGVYLEGPLSNGADGAPTLHGVRLRMPPGAQVLAPAATPQALTGTLAGDGSIDVLTLTPAPAARLVEALPADARLVLEGYAQVHTTGALRIATLEAHATTDTLRIGPPPQNGRYARVTLVKHDRGLSLAQVETRPASAWPGLDTAPEPLEIIPRRFDERPDLERPETLLEPPWVPGAPGNGPTPPPLPGADGWGVLERRR